ncbi:hypothetical protein GYMLUDRAFT_61565 [Collybiopsis luxurians FD-317 M1]|uniref:Methyltransferase domain-containing protein n=1 Tax=Collybiopsis luxurians FD-317 M1 TaxID=944289 RepID=A0A0D0CPK6_9AGAR|nr:hypothetical protein GYMLUDRAFT_61565 [Collybiopsis luxurians FD-317 M1]
MDEGRVRRSPPRPPFLRSQSDNSSTTTIIAPSLSQFQAFNGIGNKDVTNAGLSPQRPPRNPARSVVVSGGIDSGFEAKADASRLKTVTGTKEEVTPWELYPPPPDEDESPVPPVPSTSKRKSNRPSSAGNSSGSGIHFSDLSLLPSRRKSIGSRPPSKGKAPPSPNIPPHSPSVLHKQRSGSGISNSPNYTPNGNVSPRLTHKIANVVSSHPTSHTQQPSSAATAQNHTTTPPSRTSRHSTFSFGQPLAASHQAYVSTQNKPTSSTPFPLSPVQKSHSNPDSKSSSKSSFENNVKFSTADRTILEELKRNIMARESQFVMKGPNIKSRPGCESQGLLGGNGSRPGLGGMGMGGLCIMGGSRKHHPYKKEEVPYPRSYDREVLDLDVWETLFYQQICESLTWHVFKEPPTKVLDIGTGTGSWIIDCARAWRKCHFVGMDIVPIQPDLQQVGSADLAHRVTWVQGNFLEGLPFPNDEFDFVHIKRISLGVPEDKWDYLFEEITRVMKPGAAFEMIEEDLLFPGRVVRNEDEDDRIISEASGPRFDNDVDSAYFSDSDVRHYGPSSYFAYGSSTRNRHKHRSSGSVGSNATAVDLNRSNSDRSSRRQSVPAGASRDKTRRHSGSKKFDYATLTALMGLSDSETLESEQDDETSTQRGRASDRDSLLANTTVSRRNSSVGDGERVSEEFFFFPVSSSPGLTTPGTSPIQNSPVSPIPSIHASPIPTSMPSVIPKHPVVTTTLGRGIGVDAIVEDEEGEKSATLDTPPEDAPPETVVSQDARVHQAMSKQSMTVATSRPTRRSYQPPIPLSASTSSLTDLRLLSPSPSYPASSGGNGTTSPGLPPKRPLSALSSMVGGIPSPSSPAISFSQSMLSLTAESPLTKNAGGVDLPEPRSSGVDLGQPTAPAAPFVLRALPKPPVNPRDHSLLEMIYNEMNASRFVNLSPLSLLPNILGLHFKDLRTHPPVLFTFPPIPVIERPQSEHLQSPFNGFDPDEEAREAIRPTPKLHTAINAAADPARGRRLSNAGSTLSSPITGSPPPTSRTAYFEGGAENEHEHWISMQQIIKRESPYIVYDGSRLSAFSPSTRAFFLSSSKAQATAAASSSPPSASSADKESRKEDAEKKVEDDAIVDADGADTPRGTVKAKVPRPQIKFRLPNTTMNIDLRSLNLHLALRVTEILACSESMWEWILENQERTRKQKRTQDTRTAGRVRSRSIDPNHTQPRHKQGESSSDRLNATLLELTREDFDDLLRRFYM